GYHQGNPAYKEEIANTNKFAWNASDKVTTLLEKENGKRIEKGKPPLRIPKFYPTIAAIELDMHNTKEMVTKEINRCIENYDDNNSRNQPEAPPASKPTSDPEHLRLIKEVSKHIGEHQIDKPPPAYTLPQTFPAMAEETLQNEVRQANQIEKPFIATDGRYTRFNIDNTPDNQIHKPTPNRYGIQTKSCYNCGSTDHLKRFCPHRTDRNILPAGTRNNIPQASTPVQNSTPPQPNYVTTRADRSDISNAEVIKVLLEQNTNIASYNRMLDSIPVLQIGEPHKTYNWLKSCESVAKGCNRPLKEVCQSRCDHTIRGVLQTCETDLEVWDTILSDYSDLSCDNQITARLSSMRQKPEESVAAYNKEYTSLIERVNQY
ncbi:MAG: hypothetical protein MJA29_11805, partial [Candidatus Omnitrophica bacterium]|nr:hypothetical protein [Candidatus Omnitrophota bacterium]